MRTAARACGVALAAALTFPMSPIAAAESSIDWSKAQRVDAVMVDYRFEPSAYRFRHGVAYRLHLENRGTELHEYNAPAFFKSVELRDPAVLNRDRTEIEVPPGAHRDLYFVALSPGKFPLRCPDHDWAGMVGTITVE
jgi:uncharacterized cupredoxin-like copper-binding protein